MNLKNLADQDLLSRTRALVQEERRVTALVLHHLREVERRRLFSDLGYPSLFEYVVKDLHYSESAAYRRISAMRVMKEIPEIEEKIESGALSLSVISDIARHFKGEVKRREILKAVEGKSTREAEKVILAHSPNSIPGERVRAVTETHSELRVVVPQEVLDQLERIKGLLGHSHPQMTTGELLAYMAKLTLAALDPAREPKRSVAAPEVHRRSPGAPLRRRIWRRDHGRCTNCKGTYRIQIDHIRPWSLGGPTTEANLRLLCFHCNQRAALWAARPNRSPQPAIETSLRSANSGP